MLFPLALACSILVHLIPGCRATTIAHLREKRARIICRPFEVAQDFSFRDCVGAYNLMAEQAHDRHHLVTFGTGPNVDVRIEGGPLSWEVGMFSNKTNYIVPKRLTPIPGTCAIELQALGTVPQLSSWHILLVEALQIAHRCALVHQQGYTYISESPLEVKQ